MDDSKVAENTDRINGNHGVFKNLNDSFESKNDIANLIKCFLLVGADTLLLTQKFQREFKETKIESKYDMQFSDDKDLEKPICFFHESNSRTLTLGFENNVLVTFASLLLLKLTGFQKDLLMRLLRFPFELINTWLTWLMLPVQAMTLAKEQLKQNLANICKNCIASLMSYIIERLKMQKFILKLGIRICWAVFCSIYVWFVLVGLLILGFVIGGITMRYLVEEPIKTIETLNFDYTKPSLVAFVPINSSPVAGMSGSLVSEDRKTFSKHVGGRSIPYHHKLKISVSFKLPESDYNTNLGIFQVRIECLSVDGKVTASFTHPTMLRYKSQPIKYIETLMKKIPFFNGFQSEVQNLKVGAIDFKEGIEPISSFKVSIDQRARHEPGFGIPEIYAAKMNIETQLPMFKRFIWNWRRTVFVWLNFSVFLMEVAIFMIFCRPIILPGRDIKAVGAKGRSIESQ